LACLGLVWFVSLGKPIRFPTVVQGVIIFDGGEKALSQAFLLVVCRHPTMSLGPTRHPLLTADWRFSRTFFFVMDHVVFRLFYDTFL
jgi:hypothetical protein